MEAIVSMNDDLGPQVNGWTTDTLSLNIENDIQLEWNVFGRKQVELYSGDWVRGGFNLYQRWNKFGKFSFFSKSW